jgi:hypothetical protein
VVEVDLEARVREMPWIEMRVERCIVSLLSFITFCFMISKSEQISDNTSHTLLVP